MRCDAATSSQSTMSDRMRTMSSNGQQAFSKPLFVNVMCKQHTSEKGLCSEFELDLLL